LASLRPRSGPTTSPLESLKWGGRVVSKSSGRTRSGSMSTSSLRGGPVTVIDMPVKRSYAKRAKIAFFVAAGVVGTLAGTVIARHLDPVVGLLAGLLIGAVVGVVVYLVVVAWPVLRVFWHWLPEILAAVGLLILWTLVMESTALTAVFLAVIAVVGLSIGLAPLLIRRRWSARPGWRWLVCIERTAVVLATVGRYVMSTMWCLIVRHRLRVCFAAFIHVPGTLAVINKPLILWARPTPAGERVWVWLRPGLALSDLEGRTDQLAVACWANTVRVIRATSPYAALIRVDITRRDPLRAKVASPLVRMVPADDEEESTSPGMPPVLDLDLGDITDLTNREPKSKHGREPRAPKPVEPANPAAVDEYDAFI